jgi:hypothetical protein
MRRVSNTNTLRIGIFGTWYSVWYDKEYYTFLVYKDYKLIEYLNSIFYRARIPTTHFYLNRVNNNYYFIELNAYLTKPSFNKFTKLLSYNKLIFRYISLLEYLFDFSLLISNNISKDKNYIDDLLKINSFSLKASYYIFYSLYSLKNILHKDSFYYVYFYSNYINNLYFNKKLNKKLFLNKVTDINKKYKLHLFNNSININKIKTLQDFKITNYSNIKLFFVNFFSFNNYKKNYFLFYNNLNYHFFRKKLIHFFIKNFLKLISFYFFLSSTAIFNTTTFYFLSFYYKLYFFLQKNFLFSKYRLLLNKNINFQHIDSVNSTLNVINKKSSLSYNLKLFLRNSRDNFRNKHYLNYRFIKFIVSNLNNNYGFISLFYIKNFNILVKESLNSSIKINREVVDMVYFKKLNKLNLFQKRITTYFKIRFFSSFNFFLEYTIFKYTGFNCFFYISYSVKQFPIFDTKLISDYICFNLKRKHKITRIFNRISQMQKNLNSKSKKIFIPLFNELSSMNSKLFDKKYISFYNYSNLFNIVFFNKIYNKDLLKKYNPVSGLRIEFSGPPKKAQMSKTIAYHNVIHDYKLVGKMPTHTVYADIHYYQSYVRLKRSTFGIKVWLFFHTRILNSNNVNKTIL